VVFTWRSDPGRAYSLLRKLSYTGTLTRPSGILSHPMGEGRGKGTTVTHPANQAGISQRPGARMTLPPGTYG
jgi:hypothetical protein